MPSTEPSVIPRKVAVSVLTTQSALPCLPSLELHLPSPMLIVKSPEPATSQCSTALQSLARAALKPSGMKRKVVATCSRGVPGSREADAASAGAACAATGGGRGAGASPAICDRFSAMASGVQSSRSMPSVVCILYSKRCAPWTPKTRPVTPSDSSDAR